MDATEQLAQLERVTRSSIEVTRGAKDEYRWSIKRYHDDTVEDEEHALAGVASADAWLRRMFLEGGLDDLRKRADDLGSLLEASIAAKKGGNA